MANEHSESPRPVHYMRDAFGYLDIYTLVFSASGLAQTVLLATVLLCVDKRFRIKHWKSSNERQLPLQNPWYFQDRHRG